MQLVDSVTHLILLGEIIRTARQRRVSTLQAAAELANVSDMTLRRIEAGQHVQSRSYEGVDTVLALACGTTQHAADQSMPLDAYAELVGVPLASIAAQRGVVTVASFRAEVVGDIEAAAVILNRILRRHPDRKDVSSRQSGRMAQQAIYEFTAALQDELETLNREVERYERNSANDKDTTSTQQD